MSLYEAEPLQQHDLYRDTPDVGAADVPISDAPPYTDTPPEDENGVPIRTRCGAGDLPHIGTSDTVSDITYHPDQPNTPETHVEIAEAAPSAGDSGEGVGGTPPEGGQKAEPSSPIDWSAYDHLFG